MQLQQDSKQICNNVFKWLTKNNNINEYMIVYFYTIIWYYEYIHMHTQYLYKLLFFQFWLLQFMLWLLDMLSSTYI